MDNYVFLGIHHDTPIVTIVYNEWLCKTQLLTGPRIDSCSSLDLPGTWRNIDGSNGKQRLIRENLKGTYSLSPHSRFFNLSFKTFKC